MQSFKEWMKAVDRELIKTCGIDSRDLADCDYPGWYEDGIDPEEAAEMVLERNDF